MGAAPEPETQQCQGPDWEHRTLAPWCASAACSDRSPPPVPFTTYRTAPLAPNQANTQLLDYVPDNRNKSCQRENILLISFVRNVFFTMLGLFFRTCSHFTRKTISQNCCEFMGVSKVAQTPSSKDKCITFALTGYWEKLSLHFLNGEHRPYC